jgi:hypothetical protein
METLEEKLNQLLQRRFGRRATVEIDRNADGIIGTVISPMFRGVDMRSRIEMVYDTLEGSLNPEERRRTVIMAPRTPEETREE